MMLLFVLNENVFSGGGLNKFCLFKINLVV